MAWILRRGGLILNLIKAMSFPKLSSRHSSVFIEALYSQGGRYVKRLEYFPTLEEWMCVEFVKTVGNETVHDIAEIFATDSYKYRAGWPDVTVWKDGSVRFLEVKSRGDALHKSQKQVINDIIKPLGLPFALIDVAPAKPPANN